MVKKPRICEQTACAYYQSCRFGHDVSKCLHADDIVGMDEPVYHGEPFVIGGK